MPMGQLFLDALGKNGMLAIWGFIICVQARFSCSLYVPKPSVLIDTKFFTGAAQGVDA